jgi:RES domain-containing protein
MTDDDEYYLFEDIFIGELDSWYSSDIKCCNRCYEDFKANWPMSLDRINDAFSIDVESFYDGSRLKDLYTEKEYLDNIYRVKCPRCGSGLENYFWAFEFNFEDFEDLEWDFHSLKNDIKETPFLVLKNDLAKKTYDLLEKISISATPELIELKLFRGRILSSDKPKKADFLAPPKMITNEGRYNHLGVPVIYAANNNETCFNELRKPEKHLYIAEFGIKENLKLLNLNNIEDYDESELLQAIVISSVISSKADDNSKHKPEYYFTRFIADCCKYLKFDGIIYPSVQIGIGKNFVFFNTKIIKEENITKVEKYV